MKLILHNASSGPKLSDIYHRAFAEANELYLVSAYLTDWDHTLKLGPQGQHFSLIVGGDFGITRVSACRKALTWANRYQHTEFLAYVGKLNFHPKAMFWRTDNSYFALIGSSNLTHAAFNMNFEANAYSELTEVEFAHALSWLAQIKETTKPVKDWLRTYREKPWAPNKTQSSKGDDDENIDSLLPYPAGMRPQLKDRQRKLAAYEVERKNFLRTFDKIAKGPKIDTSTFLSRIKAHWNSANNTRFQGLGFERKAGGADTRSLARSYMAIVNATNAKRDIIVVRELDRLAAEGNSLRKSFLSEMLCLEFPRLYPVLNNPLKRYLSDIGFHKSRGATEGEQYLNIARFLRDALANDPYHPAQNIAQLDTVIWLAYPHRS